VTRLFVPVQLTYLDLRNFSITQFSELDAKFGDDYINLRIVGEEFGHDGGCDYYLYGDREETDNEYERRTKQEAEIAHREMLKVEHENAKERALYKKLKAKYGE
jgi:hypothetical protein